MDILMIVLVGLAGVLALAFAFLFGPPLLPIGIIPMLIMKKKAEEAEQRRIDDVLEARKASEALLRGREKRTEVRR